MVWILWAHWRETRLVFPVKDKMLKKGGTSSMMKPLGPEGSSLMCMKYCDKKQIFWSVPGIKATLLTLKQRTPKQERRGKFASQLLYMSTMDQFIGCIAQQQMTMMAILDRLEHQQRVSEAQEVGTGKMTERKNRQRESSSSNEEKERLANAES